MLDGAVHKINGLLKNIGRSDHIIESKLPTVEEQIEDARQQWANAIAFFDSVTEPDLVDYAINNLQLAEKRYNLLLKMARQS